MLGMRLTQLRIFSLISTIVSTIILVAALSTDKWYVSSYSFTSAALTDKSYGIFNDCSQDDCINKREGELFSTSGKTHSTSSSVGL